MGLPFLSASSTTLVCSVFHKIVTLAHTNSPQSDTLRHIYKEKVKDSFYIDFVSQSIITMFGPFWVWQGGGVASRKGVDKTLYLYVR